MQATGAEFAGQRYKVRAQPLNMMDQHLIQEVMDFENAQRERNLQEQPRQHFVPLMLPVRFEPLAPRPQRPAMLRPASQGPPPPQRRRTRLLAPPPPALRRETADLQNVVDLATDRESAGPHMTAADQARLVRMRQSPINMHITSNSELP